MEYVNHLFMPQQTIRAIIKQQNQMTTDEQLIGLLLDEFDKINGKRVPKVGQTYKIPVMLNTHITT